MEDLNGLGEAKANTVTPVAGERFPIATERHASESCAET